MRKGVFLTAEWRQLAMVNYAVDPALLEPFVPDGTQLDNWKGQTLVSVVGFLFSNTRLLGVPVPRHRTFEEVNLRFYVKRDVNGETRRAVTFIREIVPRSAIARVARYVYNEPYVSLPMRHDLPKTPDADPAAVAYRWQHAGEWCHVRVESHGPWRAIADGSLEEFITEHYWGYTRQRDGRTVEYQVEHPRWRVRRVHAAEVVGDLAGLYGAQFARIVRGTPSSAFLADGSRVQVRRPLHISTTLTP